MLAAGVGRLNFGPPCVARLLLFALSGSAALKSNSAFPRERTTMSSIHAAEVTRSEEKKSNTSRKIDSPSRTLALRGREEEGTCMHGWALTVGREKPDHNGGGGGGEDEPPTPPPPPPSQHQSSQMGSNLPSPGPPPAGWANQPTTGESGHLSLSLSPQIPLLYDYCVALPGPKKKNKRQKGIGGILVMSVLLASPFPSIYISCTNTCSVEVVGGRREGGKK